VGPAGVSSPPATTARPGARRPSITALRRRLPRLPAACLACAAIATVNAAAWAAITPIFWVPDEQSHVGYAQFIAEEGTVPKQGGGASDEQAIAVAEMPFNIERKPTWDSDQSRRLIDSLDEPRLTRSSEGQAGASTNYPPLYYALEAIPYRFAYDANFLDRVLLMRLLSAVLAGITVAFVFLFLRELLPSTPWAWTIGALGVAFQPVFGFISGGVNNDDGLFAASAAVIYLLARAFRRGLTPWLGVAIGAALLAGLLSKQTMFGLVPGVLVGLVALVWSAPRAARWRAVTSAGAAAAVAGIPFGLWLWANQAIFDRAAATTTGGFSNEYVTSAISLAGQLSYTWQTFLPRLPFMTDQLPHYVLWDVYIKGFVGRFGWFQYDFQPWVYPFAGVILGAIALLAGVALVRERAALRTRWPELLCYLAIAAGVLGVVSVASYRFATVNNTYFEQTRYLLPLLPLYGALLALAARGAGRRWGPAVGAFVVVAAMGHSLFAQLLTIARFYA
jgi:4-amino-4-deoxy-L-arabinose transferase-like glycosyltransferase